MKFDFYILYFCLNFCLILLFLQETAFDKKGYMAYLKMYLKKVKTYLEENGQSDRVEAFQAQTQGACGLRVCMCECDLCVVLFSSFWCGVFVFRVRPCSPVPHAPCACMCMHAV